MLLSTRNLILLGIILIMVAAFLWWQLRAYRVAEPKFVVLHQEQAIEVRQYPPILVAEVTMSGERYQAINAGFRVLADYIFGNNQAKKKIAMTAPVMQEGTKIAMTAPVMQEAKDGKWVIRFVMPDQFTMATIPQPNNKAVTLHMIPSRRMAVIRFSGTNSDSLMQEKLQALRAYCAAHHLHVTGEPVMAFYNPPWILPFLRRNEIMLPVSTTN